MRRRYALAAVVVTAFLSSGCETQTVSGPEPKGKDWVVVTYVAEGPGQVLGAMKALLKTELAADRALRDAGAGLIDGNEVGQREYDLYFVGRDRKEMWQILRPILDHAPVSWTRVELRRSLNDKDSTRPPRLSVTRPLGEANVSSVLRSAASSGYRPRATPPTSVVAQAFSLNPLRRFE